MASLDHMEGDAIEMAALLIVVLIVVAIVMAYMGSSSLLNWLTSLLQNIESWFSSLFSGGGSSLLASGGGNSSLQVQNSNPLFQIPYVSSPQIPGLGTDLYPLQNIDIPGMGSDSPDSGTGVVSITGDDQ